VACAGAVCHRPWTPPWIAGSRPWVCAAWRMSIKKRIKPGKIEASPDGGALVVHFTTEITHLNEDGSPGHVEKVPESREVPVAKAMRGLRAEEIPALAQQVVDRCRYIPATKQKQVEHVLAKLHRSHSASPSRPENPPEGRERRGASCHAAGHSGGSERWAPAQPAGSTNGSSAVTAAGWRPADLLPRASVDRIEDYEEALYEDEMETKAVGAQKLLRLCTEVNNLEDISEHPTLLGVLSRELRENAKRSHELAVAITGIFLCLAHFTFFHPALTRHQCSDVTMRIVDYESKRRTVLHKELKLHQGQLAARGSAATDEERHKLVREEKRYRSILEQQDRLLLLCLLLLRDMAEDTGVEKRLVSQRLCSFLVQMLTRNSEDLVLHALGFLHKLTLFEQNKDQLVQSSDALSRLVDLAGHQNPELSALALRVCYNLSFDARGRCTFLTRTGLLGKLVQACQQASTRRTAFKLLYILSADAHLRNNIANQSPACISLALQVVVKSRESPVEADAAALCINLAADEACASELVRSDGFAKAAARGIQSADPLLLKVLRHVASHRNVRRRLFSMMRGSFNSDHGWLTEIVRLAASYSENPTVLVEAMGILAALECTSAEVPWVNLCDSGLLELLHRFLMIGFSEDDVLLECVILAGTLAMDPDFSPLMATSKIPRLLPELLAEKQDDGEIIVQLLFAIRCLLLRPETCDIVLQDTEAPGHVLDMLRDVAGQVPEARMQAIQAEADELLDVVVAVEGQQLGESRWTDQIRHFRFEQHNLEWCQRLRSSKDSPVEAPKAALHETRGGPSALGWADVGGLAERCWGGAGATLGGGGGGGGGGYRGGFGATTRGFDGYKSTRHR